ncbi:MAG: LON peptidase substrate-binding domain-containing protein, partial [Alphaproteobacteria bacterium]|nr:LON peptidase substrate-binding domain-containing protein [Alphaproteobacteria bacterium]
MENQQSVYPVLSLRDVVVFPHMVIPLFVGREKSIHALDVVMSSNQKVVLLSQKDPTIDNPGIKDLYTVGTLARVLQLLRLPDGTVKVLLEGESRVSIDKLITSPGYFEAEITPFKEEPGAVQ